MADPAPASPPPPPSGLGASPGFLLAMVGAEARRRFAQATDTLNLKPSHYGALMTLAQAGPAAQGLLARSVGIDPRNFVATLDQLQRRGLVVRSAHPTDRRQHLVQLTPEGSALLLHLRDLGAAAERALLAPLTPAEVATLHALLTKVHAAVTQEP